MPTSRAPERPAAARTVRIAGYQGGASILTRALRELGQGLAQAGAGWDVRVEDDVTAAGETAASLFDSVDRGERQICYLASGYLSSAVPGLSVLDLPFSVQDRHAALSALDARAGERLSSEVAQCTGHAVLGFWDNGFRHVTNSVRPIRSADDCAGLRIRTLDSALYREVLSALGFTPVTTDVKDLVRVVQTGEVHAQENPLTNFVGFGLWRHHPHVSLTGHFFGVLLLVCNRRWFESLSAREQAIVCDAANASTRLQRRLAADADDASIAALAGESVRIVAANDLDLGSMRRAAEPVAKRLRAQLAPELVRDYLGRVD